MKATRIRNWRIAFLLGACGANWFICAVFLLQRPAGISSLEEREKMRRGAGAFVINSADPQMFIAGRPLYQWNKWHGGEVGWVKVVEVLNWPALAGARALGAIWTAYAGPRNIGSFRGDSWVIAWLYLLLSTAQWLLIGAVVVRFVSRSAPPSPAGTLREQLGPVADGAEEVVGVLEAMTAHRVVLQSLAAVLLPFVVIATYAVVAMAMTLAGYGPGASFVDDMASGSGNVARSAAAYVNLNRLLTLPLIVVVIAIATARLPVTAAGVVTAAVTAAIIGGYPSWVVVLSLSLVYATLGGGVRFLARRRPPARV